MKNKIPKEIIDQIVQNELERQKRNKIFWDNIPKDKDYKPNPNPVKIPLLIK